MTESIDSEHCSTVHLKQAYFISFCGNIKSHLKKEVFSPQLLESFKLFTAVNCQQ